jgi:hypothetical protein
MIDVAVCTNSVRCEGDVAVAVGAQHRDAVARQARQDFGRRMAV